jgi:hypothetical protein
VLVGEILQLGRGFNIDAASIDPKAVASCVTQAKETGIVAHLLGIIPDSYFGALARGDLLQGLLVSILSGFAIAWRRTPSPRAAAPHRDRARRAVVLAWWRNTQKCHAEKYGEVALAFRRRRFVVDSSDRE